MKLAKKRPSTFIRHFLATEIFSIISVDRNPEFTLVFKELVALQAALHRYSPQESAVQSNLTIIRVNKVASHTKPVVEDLYHVLAHLRALVRGIAPGIFHEEGLAGFLKRVDSVLKPLVTCSEEVYETNRDKIVSWAKELGRVHLLMEGLIRADWTMKEQLKDAVMVYPNVLVIKDAKGQPFRARGGNISRMGVVQTPKQSNLPAYPEGTLNIAGGGC